MNADRADSYGRVMHTLQDLGPAKLHPSEQDRLRDAADTLLFAEKGDATAAVALLDVVALTNSLQDAERFSEASAEALLADVTGCGPAAVAVAGRAAVYA